MGLNNFLDVFSLIEVNDKRGNIGSYLHVEVSFVLFALGAI